MAFLFKITLLVSFLLSVPIGLSAQYCTPTADCSFGDGIIYFKAQGFTNFSGCDTTDMLPGYADFTGLTGLKLSAGNSQPIRLLSGYADQFVSIWIDDNDDGQFSSDERILTDHPVGVSFENVDLYVPSDLTLGFHRLRIQTNWQAISSEDPCEMGEYGETEDYTVEIADYPVCVPPSSFDVKTFFADFAVVDISAPNSPSGFDLEVTPIDATPTGIPTPGLVDVSGDDLLIDNLDPDIDYLVYVRTRCANGGFSEYVGPYVLDIVTCSPLVPPHLQNFSTNFGLQCWDYATGGDVAAGPQTLVGSNQWGRTQWPEPNSATSTAAHIDLEGTGNAQWMITRRFQLDPDTSFPEAGNTSFRNRGAPRSVKCTKYSRPPPGLGLGRLRGRPRKYNWWKGPLHPP